MALSIKPLFASYNPLIASKRILQVTNSDHFSQNSLPSAHNLSIAHDHTLSLPLKHHNYRSKHYAVSFMCRFLKLPIRLMTIEKLSDKTTHEVSSYLMSLTHLWDSHVDTSYYQVHKIQQITKLHVLLLGFAITTQKPTEICQVSCKNKITHQRV